MKSMMIIHCKTIENYIKKELKKLNNSLKVINEYNVNSLYKNFFQF